MTFLSKYMEVIFNKNSSNATIVTGPVTIMGMVTGFLVSGRVITKYKPGPSKLFFWNVIVGFASVLGQISYIFLSCNHNNMLTEIGTLNLTAECNVNCSCDAAPYSPICHEATGTTYFSPCHAGCVEWDDNSKTYGNCGCAAEPIKNSLPDWMVKSRYMEEEEDSDVSTMVPVQTTQYSSTYQHKALNTLVETISEVTTVAGDDDDDDDVDYYHNDDDDDTNSTVARIKRLIDDKFVKNFMTPGACLAGCAFGFWTFTSISLLINWLGATGRIGNILLNFR